MTKAPTTIWAWPHAERGWYSAGASNEINFGLAGIEAELQTEYISRSHCDALVAKARAKALREAQNIDFRNLWISNFNRMRKAGESHVMAGRWFPQLCRDEIENLIPETSDD